MKTDIKTLFSRNKALIVLSLISVACGVVSCVLGEMLLPPTVAPLAALYFLPLIVAPLAALYLFDTDSKRTFSLIVSAILLGINIAVILLGYCATLFAPCAIILSAITAYAFLHGQSKADTSYLMTVIFALFSVGACVLLAMMHTGEWTLEAAKTFYLDLHDSLRQAVIKATEQTPDLGVDVELMTSIFDLQVSLLISYFLIGAFAVVGLSMKLFRFIVRKVADNEQPIIEWRFETTNIFAYAYLVLAIASMFVYNPDSVFAVSVLNLYMIFVAVFAYVGFNFVVALLSGSMSRGRAIFTVVALALLLSSFAIQLLAILGVMFTIRDNRKEHTDISTH